MIIKDELMSPFTIEIDDKQFTVIEPRSSKKETSTEYTKTVGHFTTLQGALNEIAKQLVHSDSDRVVTLKEYIEECNAIVIKLTEKIKV